MTVKRRVGLLGVAAAALAALPVSLLVGAWLARAIQFEAERAFAFAATLSTIVIWLGVLRLHAAALVLRRSPIGE